MPQGAGTPLNRKNGGKYMYLATKKVIREKQITVRIKSLNWQGTQYGLEVDGEIVRTGSEELIYDLYDNF